MAGVREVVEGMLGVPAVSCFFDLGGGHVGVCDA